MKERVNLALADIRFIQSEIQKILNRQRKMPNMDEGERRDRKGSKQYRSNASPNPSRKNSKSYQKASKNTSPRAKKKDSPTKKLQTFNSSPQPFQQMQAKFTKTQPKIEKQQIKQIPLPQKAPQAQPVKPQASQKQSIMQMWKQKQKQSKSQQPPKAQKSMDSPQKSAMAIWKERQRQRNGENANPPKQPVFVKSPLKAKENDQRRQPVYNFSQTSISSLIKPEAILQEILKETLEKEERKEAHHLLRKNNIPLRTDEEFLKKKYNYAYHQHNSEKEKELRERYQLLDERLIRLRCEIRTRDSNLFQSFEGHSQSKQAKVIKKQALAKYDRYSPLNKFVRINEKLKKDYERSISNKQRHNSKKKVQVQEGRLSWLK